MGKKNSYFKQRILTPAEQLYYMQLCWPGFAVSRSGSVISWTGQITPAAMCDTYTVRVSHKSVGRPDVEVVAPKLRAYPGKRLPHMFSDGTLCLHLSNEWNGGKIIAHTVMHWAARWLFFYEIWLLTGDWQGGGHEPSTNKTDE